MSEPLEVADVPTPIGTFRVLYRGTEVHLVDLIEKGQREALVPAEATWRRRPFPKGSPAAQLEEYFRGERRRFDVEVVPETASRFDRDVWRALCEVPAGATVSYGELARRSGYPGAARAVGGAMHRNPIPLIVPCHRVVGASHSLTGFGLGLWRKRWLLDHEGAWPLQSRSIEGPRDPAQQTLDPLLGRGTAYRRRRTKAVRRAIVLPRVALSAAV